VRDASSASAASSGAAVLHDFRVRQSQSSQSLQQCEQARIIQVAIEVEANQIGVDDPATRARGDAEIGQSERTGAGRREYAEATESAWHARRFVAALQQRGGSLL
jgi:hypothetical protein